MKKISAYLISIYSVIIFLTILGSINYVDTELSERVIRFLISIHKLHKAAENIPDLLIYLVFIGTILMWVIYFYRLKKKKNDINTKFLKLAATTLPVVYLLKTFFQFAFGRTTPWLILTKPIIFDWFNKNSGGSFPSGHMAVFSAFGSAIIFCFPKYRKIVLIFLMLLGIALILTNYHFLSDVIAGAYLGFITTYALWYLFEK